VIKLLNVHDASATELKMIILKTDEDLNHVLTVETILKITGLNIKCVFIIFKNIFARIVVVVRFVFIIFKDVFARIVVVVRFVFIIFKDVFANFAVVQIFVFINYKDIGVKPVQIQLK